jgi:hypothetical protein
MANIKISELIALTAPAAADELAVVDVSASSTKKTTVGEVVGIINGDVEVASNGTATISELPVSKLQDGAARQLLQTDAAGTGVEWTSNVDVPGTLDVTGAATFDAAVTIAGDLTVNGTTTNINTQNLVVKDKNIILADVASPTDVTADGGGITLKGATDKTINWVDATDAWTLSEHVNIANGKEYRINGTKVLDATSLGSSVLITSANITDGTIVNGDVSASAAIAGTKISPDFGSQNVTTTGTATAAALIPTGSTVPANGVYLSAANNVSIATNNTQRLLIDAAGQIKAVSLGSAAAPTYSWIDDPNSGLYSPGADQVAIGTNGAEQFRINSAGTAMFGTIDELPADNNVAGISFYRRLGLANFSRDGFPSVIVNRKTSDGDLVIFKQDGTSEGTISVSGTTVSYNGAHLSRWSQLPGGTERTEILRGTVLSNIDEMCAWGEEDNEQLNRMKVSDVEGDPNVAGVFQDWDDDDDTYTDDFYCAMTGDFIIRIAQGTSVQRGDLLMSAGDGTAKPQNDDIVRSKTVAKVTSTHVTCTYDDGSYCVPCVLMAC